MSDSAEVYIDPRLASAYDLSDGTFVRTELVDPAQPPFDDPEVYYRALRRACEGITAGWPRPNVVTMESMRPMVFAHARPMMQVLLPDSGMTDAHTAALERLPQEFPNITFTALEVPR